MLGSALSLDVKDAAMVVAGYAAAIIQNYALEKARSTMLMAHSAAHALPITVETRGQNLRFPRILSSKFEGKPRNMPPH
jgi:hypothetical protein